MAEWNELKFTTCVKQITVKNTVLEIDSQVIWN